jgi:hypothetical protein
MATKKSDKSYKKKSYGEPHIGQEWESNDESSNSDSDSVATVAIKGTSSSSKSLFPKPKRNTLALWQRRASTR